MTTLKFMAYLITWHPIHQKANWDKVKAMKEEQCFRFLLAALPIGCYFGILIATAITLPIDIFFSFVLNEEILVPRWPFSVVFLLNAFFCMYCVLRYINPKITLLMESPKKAIKPEPEQTANCHVEQ